MTVTRNAYYALRRFTCDMSYTCGYSLSIFYEMSAMITMQRRNLGVATGAVCESLPGPGGLVTADELFGWCELVVQVQLRVYLGTGWPMQLVSWWPGPSECCHTLLL